MSGFVPSAFFPANGGGGLPVPELDAPTYTAPSAGDYVIGGYHDLDGVDERIEFGDISALDFDYATDTFTVSLWLNVRSGASNGIVFGNTYGSESVGQGEGWCISANTSNVRLALLKASNYKIWYFLINTNTWMHVLFVFSAGGTVAGYKDGVLQSVVPQGSITPPLVYTNSEAVVGSFLTGFAPIKAYVAEVAVWSSDQSANVAAIYNSRARHDLMDLPTPPDVFYAPLTSYGDNPDGTADGVFEAVNGNDGTGVNMETADAVMPPGATITSSLTKQLDVATSVVTTTKVEDVFAETGTGSSFP